MDLSSQKERWAVWAVQARNFAKRENYTDAVARMNPVSYTHLTLPTIQL